MTYATTIPYADLHLAIGGRAIGPQARETIAVLDPSAGTEIGRLPLATDDDLRDVLEVAERGFARWRTVSAYDRARVMRGAAALLRERVDSIARILTLEEGKALGEARLEVLAAADIIEWGGEEARRAYGTVVPARDLSISQMVLREPVGPVAAFTPWNFPALTPARKLAGALGAGCSIVLKPAEETPATALALLAALRDAGLPEDAASIVFGDPPQVSRTLIASPVIRKISFTGSTPVGKELARLAAAGVKKATLELGGHAPVIVTDNADISNAVALSVPFKFRNAGQVCVSPTRFLVHERVADEFVDAFARETARIAVGHGLTDGTTMAALANARRRDAIGSLVDDARAGGARVLSGGSMLEGAGFFYAPTVLTDVPADARILNEEPFGPVAVVTRVPDLDAAIAEANRLPYGLAAYAFTDDVGEAHRIAQGVEAGMIGINHFGVSVADLPFGGVKESGYGSEGGPDALREYLVTKSVTTRSR
ncbi:MAG: Aldehyde Dehydrogenase [Candidatus Eremiobacteraeota bacterium]|nr:Aldehyde Dehydrogenase [Candidatus Eremiobacteraeota bacterium]